MNSRIAACLLRGLIAVVGLGVVAASVPTAAVAQQMTTPGQVTGQLRDALDRPISGAGVRLEDVEGRVVARTQSDREGRFVLREVPPGVYSLVAEQPGFQTTTSVVTVREGAAATTNLTMAATQSLDLKLATKRLDEARNGLSPDIGTNVYKLDQQSIQNLPQGANTPLDQVLLQAPGVVLDSKASGSFHIRNEHGNVQYRLNGILLPAGISGFQQNIDTRFVDSLKLITGALPAQYGFRTAGVVDIQTKSGAFEQGGNISMWGGSHDTIQPGLEYGGSIGTFNYFAAGSYRHTTLGIENPTDRHEAIHDKLDEEKGLGYFSYLFPNLTSRVSLILGAADSYYQIPNIPGRTPTNTVNGLTIDSAQLNQRQIERNQFGIVALQDSTGSVDYQVAYFSRYSALHYQPDPLGDLVFNGIQPDLIRRSFTNGVQADGSYPLSDTHTLRSGLFMSWEDVISDNTATVFPGDAGAQTVDAPFVVADKNTKTARTYGLYLQDEWKALTDVTINYGARLDTFYAFRHESQLSPRLNAVYNVTPTTTLHGGYARYFTPPPVETTSLSALDRFVGTTAANTGNGTTLDPPFSERAHVFDAGVTQRVTNELQVGVDAYYKYSRNLIDEGQFGAPVILTPFNYARGINQGIEFTSTYTTPRLTSYFNFTAASQMATQITSGQANFSQDDLNYIGGHWIHTDHDQSYTASAGISYAVTDTLRTNADLLYGTGTRKAGATPNGSHNTPYRTIDLGAVQRVTTAVTGDVDLRVAVINVLDASYKIRDGTGIGVGAPQYGARRAFYGGFTKYF